MLIQFWPKSKMEKQWLDISLERLKERPQSTLARIAPKTLRGGEIHP